MYPLVVENVPVDVAIGLKNQLLISGLKIDVDFTWAYFHPIRDSYAYTEESPSKVIFEFKDPAMASFYTLKWL